MRRAHLALVTTQVIWLPGRCWLACLAVAVVLSGCGVEIATQSDVAGYIQSGRDQRQPEIDRLNSELAGTRGNLTSAIGRANAAEERANLYERNLELIARSSPECFRRENRGGRLVVVPKCPGRSLIPSN